MTHEELSGALERSLATLIAQFAELPDRYLRAEDLQAAFYHALAAEGPLQAPCATRDGRYTTLLHREYPGLLAYEAGATSHQGMALPCYDVAILNPAFVRSSDLKTVANANPRQRLALRALPPALRPVPLVAAANLRLIEGLIPDALAELEGAFQTLVRAEPDAPRRYLAVFCRHWDLDGQLHRVLDTLSQWAENHNQVSLVFVQAYRDDAGRIFGGRYLNFWTYRAPLLPLDPPFVVHPHKATR